MLISQQNELCSFFLLAFLFDFFVLGVVEKYNFHFILVLSPQMIVFLPFLSV